MIVGLCGVAGAGKSTAARALVALGYVELSLAAPIKRIARDLFGFSVEQLNGPSSARNAIDPRYGVSPRHVLQTLGTDWARAVDPNVWVRRLIADASEHERVVVPDVRFRNEVDAIRDAGGIVIRLLRGLHASTDDHPSERAVREIPADAFFAEIDNREATVEQMQRDVVVCVSIHESIEANAEIMRALGDR